MKKTVGSVFFAILFCVLTACENGGVSLGISSDNKMSTLSVSQGTLMPAFSPDVFKYSASVNYMDSTFDLTFSPSSSKAVCIVNGEVVTGNTARVPLAVGTNTIVVSVTAEDGTTRSYTIVVTRAEAASAPDLQSITYSTCQAGYYSDNVNGCSQVGLNYYSPANDNARYACANKPANSRYTSPIASSANCPWSCSNGYITTNGTLCTSSPTATTLSCNDDEIAVGLYGKEGSIIDRIGVRCATIDAAGNLGSPRNGPDYGGTGGGWFNDSGAYDCPAGYAVYRIEGSLATYSSVPRTGAISFQCKSVTNPAASPVARPNRADADFGNSYDRGLFAFECGVSPNLYGAFLNGIIIDNASGAAYAGDTLGITCR